MSIEELMRDNIVALEPYRCARDEFEGVAEVYLDANESWRSYIDFPGDINRYPDPRSSLLRKAIDEVLGLDYDMTIVGNGSDEIIDLLFRIFCNPGKDSVLLMGPTYGAYKVFASINDVKVNVAPLTEEFAVDVNLVKKMIDETKPKLVFLCSPNNPTGNKIDYDTIKEIATYNQAITVVDEAYWDFSSERSASELVKENERVVLMRTLSKAWGLASARIGIAMCSKKIHEAMYNVKYPYNVGLPSSTEALKALSNSDKVREGVEYTKKERERLVKLLKSCDKVVKVYPSDANFLLVKVTDADSIYIELQKRGIVVRNRSRELNCANCLRITVGSRDENDRLIKALGEL